LTAGTDNSQKLCH